MKRLTGGKVQTRDCDGRPRFAAALRFRAKKWDGSRNVQNLGDEDYIRAANGRLSIRPGSPRDFCLRFRQRL